MPILLALIAQLLSLVGGQIDVHTMEARFPITDLYGARRQTDAALSCPGQGRPELWIARTASDEVRAHELAHAVDCLDDRLLNGSPSRRPKVRPAWTSDYCWQSDAEWYACSVVHHQRIDPHNARNWSSDAVAVAWAAATPDSRVRIGIAKPSRFALPPAR